MHSGEPHPNKHQNTQVVDALPATSELEYLQQDQGFATREPKHVGPAHDEAVLDKPPSQLIAEDPPVGKSLSGSELAMP